MNHTVTHTSPLPPKVERAKDQIIDLDTQIFTIGLFPPLIMVMCLVIALVAGITDAKILMGGALSLALVVGLMKISVIKNLKITLIENRKKLCSTNKGKRALSYLRKQGYKK